MEFLYTYTGFWLALAVIFMIVEAATVGVVSAWFAVGALCAMGGAMLDWGLGIQILIFVVVSVLLLLCLRPLTKKYFTPKLTKTNVDAVIGTEGVVIEAVDNLQGVGRIKLGGMEWAARSTGGEKIPQGTMAKVDKIEGVKVFITPVKVNQEV